jgi:uncharacterized protein (DUF2236 family)
MDHSTIPDSSYYFPPGTSVARRIHEERVVGIFYGPRALLLGALDPLTYTATMLGTKSTDRPFRRLARTARIQETVLLGTREEADRALVGVRRQHQRVKGRLDKPVGVHPAGTGYSAFDQELMLWTLAVIADSALAIYEAMVRPLSESERESLWQDYRLFGELFGMSPDAMPATHWEFSAWLENRMHAPEMTPTAHALKVAPSIAFEMPVQFAARPILYFNNLMIKGTLTEGVREVFGIRWTPAHQAAFKVCAAFHRAAGRLLPDRLRRGRNGPIFDNVAKVEARRGGIPIPDPA